MATFLVTSHGRSGTKWLARELNRSKAWWVLHEGPGIFEGRTNYGEVNSHLRHRPPETDKLGVIIRDPMAIARSAYHKAPARWDQFLSKLQNDLTSVHCLLLQKNTIHIRFDDMIRSRSLFGLAAKSLGVCDLNLDTVDFSPCNSSSQGMLTAKQRLEVEKIAGWYRRAWC